MSNYDHGMIVSIPLQGHSTHWAYALYEPTPEDRKAQAESFRELGRRARERVDAIVWEVLTRDV